MRDCDFCVTVAVTVIVTVIVTVAYIVTVASLPGYRAVKTVNIIPNLQ